MRASDLFYAHLCDQLHSISMRISNSTSLIIKLTIKKQQTHSKIWKVDR